jgi:HAD superfamily hydrolase (TIGR01509 family)
VLKTVFLDAGGVIVFPNWFRISAALAARGVRVAPQALADAEPVAKRKLDDNRTVQITNDAGRGWLYFNLIFDELGVVRSPQTDEALAELHTYHQQSNLWELVPDEVMPALAALRDRGLTLTVVSNANGRLRALLERLNLVASFDCVLDSHDEGVEKPDPRIFEIALARSGATRDSTIHVGDLYQVDVVGARAAGLRGVLLDQKGLYGDADCPRVRSLADLADQVARGVFD